MLAFLSNPNRALPYKDFAVGDSNGGLSDSSIAPTNQEKILWSRVLVGLSRPHSRLVLECLRKDLGLEIVHSSGLSVTREMLDFAASRLELAPVPSAYQVRSNLINSESRLVHGLTTALSQISKHYPTEVLLAVSSDRLPVTAYGPSIVERFSSTPRFLSLTGAPNVSNLFIDTSHAVSGARTLDQLARYLGVNASIVIELVNEFEAINRNSRPHAYLYEPQEIANDTILDPTVCGFVGGRIHDVEKRLVTRGLTPLSGLAVGHNQDYSRLVRLAFTKATSCGIQMPEAEKINDNSASGTKLWGITPSLRAELFAILRSEHY